MEIKRYMFLNNEIKVYYVTMISMCCSNWQFGDVSLVALPVRRGGNGRSDDEYD